MIPNTAYLFWKKLTIKKLESFNLQRYGSSSTKHEDENSGPKNETRV